ncbi:MAG: ribosomal protein L13e [Thaumarchaeota archaeon]|nr:ribosomal protein L13e [Candidatus Calditenuaceae archaeon]MDW8187069.1 ribosomal protein L13e [Nitrososphaerota archaeon]
MKAEVIAPGKGRRRDGRGFSIEEIKAAGLTLASARREGLPIDLRRRSAHEQNVELLRRLVSSWKGSDGKG